MKMEPNTLTNVLNSIAIIILAVSIIITNLSINSINQQISNEKILVARTNNFDYSFIEQIGVAKKDSSDYINHWIYFKNIQCGNSTVAGGERYLNCVYSDCTFLDENLQYEDCDFSGR
jgi:hypothetical protein